MVRFSANSGALSRSMVTLTEALKIQANLPCMNRPRCPADDGSRESGDLQSGESYTDNLLNIPGRASCEIDLTNCECARRTIWLALSLHFLRKHAQPLHEHRNKRRRLQQAKLRSAHRPER